MPVSFTGFGITAILLMVLFLTVVQAAGKVRHAKNKVR